MKANTNVFSPGDAFDENTKQKAKWSSVEVELKF
jgi:hypothetical protein